MHQPQAAQALEPAALIPMPMLSATGRVVLVGDPAQLPATVLSGAAAAANLAQSLFERLQRVRCADMHQAHPLYRIVGSYQKQVDGAARGGAGCQDALQTSLRL